jgi:hypothetical protein
LVYPDAHDIEDNFGQLWEPTHSKSLFAVQSLSDPWQRLQIEVMAEAIEWQTDILR